MEPANQPAADTRLCRLPQGSVGEHQLVTMTTTGRPNGKRGADPHLCHDAKAGALRPVATENRLITTNIHGTSFAEARPAQFMGCKMYRTLSLERVPEIACEPTSVPGEVATLPEPDAVWQHEQDFDGAAFVFIMHRQVANGAEGAATGPLVQWAGVLSMHGAWPIMQNDDSGTEA